MIRELTKHNLSNFNVSTFISSKILPSFSVILFEYKSNLDELVNEFKGVITLCLSSSSLFLLKNFSTLRLKNLEVSKLFRSVLEFEFESSIFLCGLYSF